MGQGSTGAAAGGGALYGDRDLRRVVLFWQQANSFWDTSGRSSEGRSSWPAFMVYEGFRALGA